MRLDLILNLPTSIADLFVTGENMKVILGAFLASLLSVTSANAAQAPSQDLRSTAKASNIPAAPDTSLDPASLELAHQILTIGFPPAKRSQMYASVMDSIVAQTRKSLETYPVGADKDLQAIINRSVQRMYDEIKANINAGIPDIFESFARAYVRDFSREDLEAILAFVKTPAGQHYFERASGLLKDPDVQAANQRMMARFLAKLPEIQRETIRDVADYVAKKEKSQKGTTSVPVS